MRKHLVITALALASLALAAPDHAHARGHSHHHHSAAARIDCDLRGCRAVSGSDAEAAGPAREWAARGTARHGGHPRKTHRRGSLPFHRVVWETIRSAAGAATQVATSAAGRFRAYIADLEAHGAKIYYMGGIRRGRCSPGSQHPCGTALDVCQDYRGHVSGERNCNLPPPAEMAEIAHRHGLQEGSTWCRSPDYGHAQVMPTGSECRARGSGGRKLATMTGKMVEVSP